MSPILWPEYIVWQCSLPQISRPTSSIDQNIEVIPRNEIHNRLFLEFVIFGNFINRVWDSALIDCLTYWLTFVWILLGNTDCAHAEGSHCSSLVDCSMQFGIIFQWPVCWSAEYSGIMSKCDEIVPWSAISCATNFSGHFSADLHCRINSDWCASSECFTKFMHNKWNRCQGPKFHDVEWIWYYNHDIGVMELSTGNIYCIVLWVIRISCNNTLFLKF